MSKTVKYSNDRSFDNLLLILMHTYIDLKSLSNQDDISKNYILRKIDCLEEVQKAYFRSAEISKREWDGIHYKELPPEPPPSANMLENWLKVPRQEIDWFNRTLTLATNIYYKLENGSNISEDDISPLRNYIQDCISLLADPPFRFYKWMPIYE